MKNADIMQVWTAGQVIGLIHDIPTCHDLVTRIEREAIEALQKAQNLIVDEVPQGKIAGKSADHVQAGGQTGPAKAKNPGAEVWGVGKSKL